MPARFRDAAAEAGGGCEPKARPCTQMGGILITGFGASRRARAGLAQNAEYGIRVQSGLRAQEKAGFAEAPENRPRASEGAAAERDDRVLIVRRHVVFLVEEPQVGRSGARHEGARVQGSRRRHVHEAFRICHCPTPFTGPYKSIFPMPLTRILGHGCIAKNPFA